LLLRNKANNQINRYHPTGIAIMIASIAHHHLANQSAIPAPRSPRPPNIQSANPSYRLGVKYNVNAKNNITAISKIAYPFAPLGTKLLFASKNRRIEPHNMITNPRVCDKKLNPTPRNNTDTDVANV